MTAENIKFPTLIIWGDRDRITHPEGANVLKKLIPQAQKTILQEVGHLPMLEQPKTVAELYLNFLKTQAK